MLRMLHAREVDAYVEVIGAGATAPSSTYTSWMAAYRSYRRQFVDVRLKYSARGSGYGKQCLTTRNAASAGTLSVHEIFGNRRQTPSGPSSSALHVWKQATTATAGG